MQRHERRGLTRIESGKKLLDGRTGRDALPADQESLKANVADAGVEIPPDRRNVAIQELRGLSHADVVAHSIGETDWRHDKTPVIELETGRNQVRWFKNLQGQRQNLADTRAKTSLARFELLDAIRIPVFSFRNGEIDLFDLLPQFRDRLAKCLAARNVKGLF